MDKLKDIQKQLAEMRRLGQNNSSIFFKKYRDLIAQIYKEFKKINQRPPTFIEWKTMAGVDADPINRVRAAGNYPLGKNIENLEIYNSNNRYKDLFFALSHGVNFGKLKPNNTDERESFLNELFQKNKKLTFNILGYASEQPKWNYQYFSELAKCKMALNLSRGVPSKYASSNRIASLIGNGLMTFIDKRTSLNEIFNSKEVVFYTSIDDLASKIKFYKGKDSLRKQIARKGKNK